MVRPFWLYNNLVELCDAVIAMGAGAFRGTSDTSHEWDAEGSDEEGEEVYQDGAISEELAVSEDWDLEEPMVHLIVCWLNHALCPDSLTPFRDPWG